MIEHENEIESNQANDTIYETDDKKTIIKKRSNSNDATTSDTSNSKNRSSMVKRSKSTLLQKRKIIQKIPLDSTGQPIFPIAMGNFTMHALGEIVFDRPGFHTESSIYPVGYTISRAFGHLKDPDKKSIYTCKILDNGDDGPRFEIVPDSDYNLTISGSSADYCHQTLLKCINNSSDILKIDTCPQGDWFFGLEHPTVMTLITSIPNSKRCSLFKGFKTDGMIDLEKENDPTLNYDALRHAVSVYHTVPEIKEELELPDELLGSF